MSSPRSKVRFPRCFQVVTKDHGSQQWCFVINEQSCLPLLMLCLCREGYKIKLKIQKSQTVFAFYFILG